jgi:predicted GIY-YIG superfamily endonuclease
VVFLKQHLVTMTTPLTTDPLATHDSTAIASTSTNSNNTCCSEAPRWTRLNHKGIYHDNRRLLKHRAKNCECFVCYREIYKLPPMETHQEYVATVKSKVQEREIKKAIRKAKKDVKTGKQGSIKFFFPASLP